MVIKNYLTGTYLLNDSLFRTVFVGSGYEILFTESKNEVDIILFEDFLKKSNQFNSNFEFIASEVDFGYEIEINY